VQRDPRVAGDEHAGDRAAALVLVALDAHPSVRGVATDQVWHPEERRVRLDVAQPHLPAARCHWRKLSSARLRLSKPTSARM